MPKLAILRCAICNDGAHESAPKSVVTGDPKSRLDCNIERAKNARYTWVDNFQTKKTRTCVHKCVFQQTAHNYTVDCRAECRKAHITC